MAYLINLLISVDCVFNALLAGHCDETLSSHAHRLYVAGKPFGFMRHVINALFFWQSDHCRNAYYDEKFRRQIPPEMR